jgi:precorrin-6Y C5,15-methyltransferase (decarboxylating)
MGNGAELPDSFTVPDKVFIGGSSGNLKAIVSTALSKNPCVRIAVTAVTLETLHSALQVFTEFGLEQNITQLAVTRTNKTGGYTMFNAQNPIFLIWGEKNEKIHNFGD